MQIWSFWLEMLQGTLQLLSSSFGLSAGVSIIGLTLLLRFVLLPVSWWSAYYGGIHQKTVRSLQPDLQALRERFKDTPEMLMEQTLKLYRRRGISFVSGRPIVGALVQMPVVLGMFQVFKSSTEAARFLWVSSLARPDLWLAILVGITTAMMIAANPDLPEQTRMILVAVPSIIAVLFALKFSSALGLYWITSNVFTAIQTLTVHLVIDRRIRDGRVVI
jgi:YidC/Oxa1 family membrane protein insertase